MWNAAPSQADDTAAATPASATVPPARLARVLHLQKFAGGIAARGAAMASNLTRNAMRFLGVPYAFGGTSGYGFDCSGFTQHVFAMMGVHLPRMADEQYYAGKSFTGQPKRGDLVFFHTYAAGVSHVGISLGDGKFIHASSSHGVMVSSLHDSYWGPRYLGAKRVVN
ncbi:MAG TPA: C40 family peptidase [Candidatus Limnocylindrales bacterium]|nr:C40 family peptidase [Candidatus Limnocylindrales bacterium]